MVKFYEKTGMYIDWDQLDRLPEIDTFIDIGVGPKGTPMFWEKYKDKQIICIDPLTEAQEITSILLKDLDYKFIHCALGATKSKKILNIEENKGRSSFFQPTTINIEDTNSSRVEVEVNTLDAVVQGVIRGRKVGIKIDTEGYELEILKGASETLKTAQFVIAEVRHNHKSFEQQYEFKDFNVYMFQRGFVPYIVFTAKPFILDIAYIPFNKNS